MAQRQRRVVRRHESRHREIQVPRPAPAWLPAAIATQRRRVEARERRNLIGYTLGDGAECARIVWTIVAPVGSARMVRRAAPTGVPPPSAAAPQCQQ